VGGIEGVGDLVEGQPVGQADRRVLGDVQRAQVLHQHVGDAGFVDELALVGRDDLVVSRRDHGVVHAGDGIAVGVELGHEVGAHHLLGQGGGGATDGLFQAGEEVEQRGQAEQGGAVGVGRDADQGVDLRRALGVVPEVVPRHHAPLGVPDEIDLGRAGGRQHLVDVLPQLGGGFLHRAERAEERHAGQHAVVEGETQ
jgi:hypothetical protein